MRYQTKHPRLAVSFVLLVTVLLLALTGGAALADDSGFDDVAADAWYAADVQYAVDNGLMKGVGEGRFSPNGLTDRAQLVTVLYRLEGSPAVSGDSFDDVAESDYFYAPVEWGVNAGIVNGYGDRVFGPKDTLTREQFASLLYRFAQFKGYDTANEGSLDGFADSDQVSAWAEDALRWAVAAGLIQGSDGNLDPAGSATRAQMAAILHRFCDNGSPDQEFDPAKAYAALLQKYKDVITGKAPWDESLGSPEFFNQIAGYDAPPAGYAFLDINEDGVEELLIGPVDMGGSTEWYDGLLYALYTYDGKQPVKLCESWERNRYYLLKDNRISNPWSNGASDSGTNCWSLREGATELTTALPYTNLRQSVAYNVFSFDPEAAYADLLQKYEDVVTGKAPWDESLGSPEFFNQIAGYDAPAAGYAFLDINGDGEEELLIGPVDMGGSEEWYKGLLYALYTYENGQPVKLCESWERNRFYLLTDGRLSNNWSNGASDSGTTYYELKKGAAGLTPCDPATSERQAVTFKSFKYDPDRAYSELLATYKAVVNGEAAWNSDLGSPEFFNQIPGSSSPKAGYALADLNGDGVDELIIAPVDFSASEEWYKSLIYVLYTYKDGEPVKLCESVVRGRYYLLADNKLSYYWSAGADDNGIYCYELSGDGSELVPTNPTTSTRKDFTVTSF